MSSLSSTWRCEECGRTGHGPQHTTVLGRTVCTPCHEDQEARTAGLLATQGVGGAVAFRVVRQWVRRVLGKPSA